MSWFHGKRVLVTGGSSGIGLAVAKRLTRDGARVAIVARGEERLARARDELTGMGGPQVEAFALDVGEVEQVRSIAPEVLRRLGGLDVLINNAGICRAGRFLDMPVEAFDDLWRVNTRGTIEMTRAFLPHFLAQGHGRIGIVGSLLGAMGLAGHSAYTTSKFALTGFADALRHELAPHDIPVSLTLPPNTDTPQLEAEMRTAPPETLEITRRAGSLSADQVARCVLRGIRTGRALVIPGWSARATCLAYRLVPGLVHRVIDHQLRKALRATNGTEPSLLVERSSR